jgi:phosphoribosylanthranilate isomerase
MPLMNSRPWVKICGLTTEAGVEAAVTAQVDAIGFVFAASKRRVTAQRALELSRNIPAAIARIAVFQHPEQSLIDEVCAVLRPDVIQTDIEDLLCVRVPNTVQVNPVVRAGRALPTPLPPRIVFEGPVSGIGTPVNWTDAAMVARRTKLILAGGLNPENVGEAIRSVNPYGVDVSSGVEASAGIKDPGLIMQFVAAVRAARSPLVVERS